MGLIAAAAAGAYAKQLPWVLPIRRHPVDPRESDRAPPVAAGHSALPASRAAHRERQADPQPQPGAQLRLERLWPLELPCAEPPDPHRGRGRLVWALEGVPSEVRVRGARGWCLVEQIVGEEAPPGAATEAFHSNPAAASAPGLQRLLVEKQGIRQPDVHELPVLRGDAGPWRLLKSPAGRQISLADIERARIVARAQHDLVLISAPHRAVARRVG